MPEPDAKVTDSNSVRVQALLDRIEQNYGRLDERLDELEVLVPDALEQLQSGAAKDGTVQDGTVQDGADDGDVKTNATRTSSSRKSSSRKSSSRTSSSRKSSGPRKPR